MGCGTSTAVKPISTIRLQVMPAITFGVPKQAASRDVPEQDLQMPAADSKMPLPVASQYSNGIGSITSIAELDGSIYGNNSHSEPLQLFKKVDQHNRVGHLPPSTTTVGENKVDLGIPVLSPDVNGRRSVIKSSTHLGSPGKGLGYILECESIYEASMKGEEEQKSKSRATLRRQSSSVIRGESKSKATKQSIFRPHIAIEVHSRNRNPSVKSDDDSSDSGIPECTENNWPSANDLPQTVNNQLDLKSVNREAAVQRNPPTANSNNLDPTHQRKLAKLPSLYYKYKQQLKQKPDYAQKSRDELTRNSQRRSLTIERDRDNIGSLAHGLFSSESII